MHQYQVSYRTYLDTERKQNYKKTPNKMTKKHPNKTNLHNELDTMGAQALHSCYCGGLMLKLLDVTFSWQILVSQTMKAFFSYRLTKQYCQMQSLLKALAVFISAKKVLSLPFPLLKLSLSAVASLELEYFPELLQGYQSNSIGKMWSALGTPAREGQ